MKNRSLNIIFYARYLYTIKTGRGGWTDMNENQNGEFVRAEKQKAILVGLNVEDKDNFMTIEDSMRELQDLAETAGATVVHIVIQNRQRVDSAYYIGKGKAEEIRSFKNWMPNWLFSMMSFQERSFEI